MVFGVTEAQIATAKEIFPSLFIQFGGSISESEIAQAIFENNFDNAIVTRSLERKVEAELLYLLHSRTFRRDVQKNKRVGKTRIPFRTSFNRKLSQTRYEIGYKV
jgi:hypothetical protein